MTHDERVQKLAAITSGVQRLIQERDGSRAEAEEAFTQVDASIDALHVQVMTASPEPAVDPTPQ